MERNKLIEQAKEHIYENYHEHNFSQENQEVIKLMVDFTEKQLLLHDVVVPKGTLFCDKENKECKYLRKKNKCGLRKRWCSYQTK